jgi:hypothetical protein
MLQKDLNVRLNEVIEAWERMRPNEAFFGLMLDDFKAKAKPYCDARDEITQLEKAAGPRSI